MKKYAIFRLSYDFYAKFLSCEFVAFEVSIFLHAYVLEMKN